jgi:predicted XRE-type DNA-binding protein
MRIATSEGARKVKVHRAIREIVEGESKLGALHHCGNKACFLPGHTYYGTQSENAEDMFRLGEFSGFGETHHAAKLSARDVVEIRETYFSTGLTQREIGDMYGVRQSAISRVLSGSRRSRG